MVLFVGFSVLFGSSWEFWSEATELLWNTAISGFDKADSASSSRGGRNFFGVSAGAFPMELKSSRMTCSCWANFASSVANQKSIFSQGCTPLLPEPSPGTGIWHGPQVHGNPWPFRVSARGDTIDNFGVYFLSCKIWRSWQQRIEVTRMKQSESERNEGQPAIPKHKTSLNLGGKTSCHQQPAWKSQTNTSKQQNSLFFFQQQPKIVMPQPSHGDIALNRWTDEQMNTAKKPQADEIQWIRIRTFLTFLTC